MELPILFIFTLFLNSRANIAYRASRSLKPLFPENGISKSKNPLVAATYYFNSEDSLGRETYSDSQSVTNTEEKEDGDGCIAPDGRRGSCYDATTCSNTGGIPMGNCPSKSNSHVCCLSEITCGQLASERFVYFRNPGFPNYYHNSRGCRVRIGKNNKDICQYRVDFIEFDIAPPNQGNCSQDIFVVSGQNENNVIPKICGYNQGHHYYFGVDESGTVSLHVMMLGTYPRKFDILITQIPCGSELSAPSHCLQYYTGTHGSLKSFNYDTKDITEGYPNDNDYIMCIKKESGFCSISYELSSEGSKALTFAIGSNGDGLPKNRPIVSDCLDDYISIGGMRLCSGRNVRLINDDEKIGDYIVNASLSYPSTITDTTPGPFLIRFVSNHVNNAKGFHLNYRQNPCK